jgi:CubicO group peptidase (beta-lactamase class C family)
MFFRTAVILILIGMPVSMRALAQDGSTACASDLSRKLDRLVTESMRDGRTPGLGLVVICDRRIAYLKTFGFADIARRTPVTPDTAVSIGSTTKAMTALALMQLVDQGKVRLNDPVVRYIPFFKVKDPAGSRISVRELLTQTSGLPPTVGIPLLPDDDPDALESLVRSFAGVRLDHAPGAAFEYSNDNYAVAGLIIQRVARLSWEAYMAKDVFAPLGMSHTIEDSMPPASASAGVWQGYLLTTGGKMVARSTPFEREYGPAGSETITTLPDLGRYLYAQVNDGVSMTGRRIVSEAAMKEMHAPLVPSTGIIDGSKVHYGFGWEIHQREGLTTAEHPGAIVTMGSYFVLVPARGIAAGVVENCLNDGNVALAINAALAAAGVKPIPRVTPPLPRQPAARLSLDQTPWQSYVGRYASANGPVSVFRAGNTLQMKARLITPQADTIELVPVGPSTFAAKSDVALLVGMTFTFSHGLGGAYINSQVLRAHKP